MMEIVLSIEAQEGATYGQQLELARLVEEGGLHGFFRSDHYLGFLKPRGQARLTGMTDAWTTLAGLARETKHIRLGTLVSPITFRLPGPLAIQVAQVDRMAGGRVELGMGAGWYEDEHMKYGIPFPRDRFARLEEQLQIVRGLWQAQAGEEFSFFGRYYQVGGCSAPPRPEQNPHPPVVLGGSGGRRLRELAAKYAEELNFRFAQLAGLSCEIERVQEQAKTLGRSGLRCSSFGPICMGRNASEIRDRALRQGGDIGSLRRRGLVGSPAEIVDLLGALSEAGVCRYYLQLVDIEDVVQVEQIASLVVPQLRERQE